MKRYNKVLRGLPARHVILKSIAAEVSYKSRDDDALWKHHDFLMVRYRKLLKEGGPLPKKHELSPSLLDVKIEIASRFLNSCRFCERRCGVDRNEKAGACGVDATSHISSEFLHTGEEPDLIPSHTIFFEGCNFNCVYCQNWTIARNIRGPVADPERIAKLIELRHRQGSTNVNFVGGDPTPHLYTILKIVNATQVNIPVVWNSNMYMTPEAMKILDGVVDLYLADFRYGNDEHAKRYSGIDFYWAATTQSFLEAKKQAELLVRQLVLPGHVDCCTKPIVEWCAANLGPDVRFNLMFQYRPEYQASRFPEINRSLTSAEALRAMSYAKKAGLKNLV
ncbi:MAG: Radical SAM superfamily protein [Methanocella sp. PtaU1.Bin125]|nr:MAG: Radical SAM superfamily protein [Methanocella sp. PtaU1.Bin125]